MAGQNSFGILSRTQKITCHLLLIGGFIFLCFAWSACPKQLKNKELGKHAEPIQTKESILQIEPTKEVSTPKEANQNEQQTEKKSIDSQHPDVAQGGLWSAFQPIDIHAHIGSFSGYDLSTPTLLSGLRAYGFRWAFISNIDGANIASTKNISEDKANQATIQTVQQNAQLLRGIYWTRPNRGLSKQADAILQTALPDKQRIFVAMKFHPSMNQFPADSLKLNPYMKLCQKYKLVAVFHSGSKGSNADPQRIYTLAKRYPKVPVVLYHMGFFGPHQQAIQVAQMAKNKKDALLYLGTAQADPQAILKAIQLLGSGYVMFGSDAAYYGKQHYDTYKKQIQVLRTKLNAKDFANVVHNNAKRIFGLP